MSHRIGAARTCRPPRLEKLANSRISIRYCSPVDRLVRVPMVAPSGCPGCSEAQGNGGMAGPLCKRSFASSQRLVSADDHQGRVTFLSSRELKPAAGGCSVGADRPPAAANRPVSGPPRPSGPSEGRNNTHLGQGPRRILAQCRNCVFPKIPLVLHRREPRLRIPLLFDVEWV